METRSAASRGSGTNVARASAPLSVPSLEKNSSAKATNKPVKMPVGIAARKIRPLIRTEKSCQSLSVYIRAGSPRCYLVVSADEGKRRGL